jgi:acetoin utilization deacetylase AcuC-like enzyme/GNAT superfamily N-acetyltransferase
MIRFQRLFELASDPERRTFAEARELFRAAFPSEQSAIDRIERMIVERARLDFEPLMLVSEDARRRVTGLTFTYYFPETQFGYLQYIASDPQRPARGLGGALYESLRELLSHKGARGLLLDVPPVDPQKLKDPARAAINRKRMRFYERLGAFPIEETLWDVEPNPRNDGYLTTLLYDDLGRNAPLKRADARKAVRRILVAQYGFPTDDPFVRRIVESFRDDPVRLRKPKKEPQKAEPPAKECKWLRPLKLVVTERHLIHHLKEKGYVERPVRVDAVLRGLAGLPVERVPLKHFGEPHIRAVHDPRLVSYLAAVCKRLGPKTLVYPEVFPIRRPERCPKELEDRAGYFCADTFTPLTQNAYPAARAAVDCALTGAELLKAGERFVYALCRPPGHHAERRIFGGFCYLNNSAIAANELSKDGKVALLDIDYHHGNGAQDIFYHRSDVYTISIHGHPRSAYPNFSGYADELGEGAGLHFNRNFPLPQGQDEKQYLEVLDKALAIVRRFQPLRLVLSLGFDIMKGDPTGTFKLSPAGMGEIARRIGRLGCPTLVVQEGGYSVQNLRTGAKAFFNGLCGTWY